MKLPNEFTITHTSSRRKYTITRDTEGFICRWEGSKDKVSYSEKQVREFIGKGIWTVVPEVKTNGVDAEGKPLNFTEDMLQVCQRVELRNGEMRVVIPNVQIGYKAKWALVNTQGWVEFDAEKPLEACEWDSVAVYAAPNLNFQLLNPNHKGALIWQAEDPQVKAKQARAEELRGQLVVAASEVAAATERMEAIKNELQSI